MGLGDGLAILMTGCVFNSKSMLIIVLLSFLIMSATGITGVIIKKTKLKTKLPFLPFLLMIHLIHHNSQFYYFAYAFVYLKNY